MARDFFVAGDIGEPLLVVAFPDSTLKTAITAAIAAGTKMTQKFIKWSTGANFEVTTASSDGDLVEGRIVGVEEYVNMSGTSTYKLTVECFWYEDANSAKYPATRMVVLPYAAGGSPALGNTVAVNSTTYSAVKDATSLGSGRIIGIDTTNLKLAILM